MIFVRNATAATIRTRPWTWGISRSERGCSRGCCCRTRDGPAKASPRNHKGLEVSQQLYHEGHEKALLTMLEHKTQNWHVRKPLAHARGGIVATPEPRCRRRPARACSPPAATRSMPRWPPPSPSPRSSRGTADWAASASCSCIPRKRIASRSSISDRSRRAGCNPADYPARRRRHHHARPLHVADGEGRPQRARTALVRRARRRSTDWGSRSSVRHAQVRRGAQARDRARRPGHRGRLVSHAQGRDDGAGARALSDDARHLAAGGLSASHAAGRAARPARADRARRHVAQARGTPAGAISTKARSRPGIANDMKALGGVIALEDLRQLPRAHRRAARDRVSRRRSRARAGPHGRAQHAARARRLGPRAFPPQRAARRRVPRLRTGAAGRLHGAARDHGRDRRPTASLPAPRISTSSTAKATWWR